MTARKVEFTLGGTLVFKVDEPEHRPGARVTVSYNGFSITAWGDDMAYTLPSDHLVNVAVQYVDAKGHPAEIDGEVTWGTSDPDIAAVEVDSGNSQMARVIPGANLGNVQISATADADIGEGTTELVTLMDVTVVGGQAVSGTIAPTGAPEPIASHAAPR